MEEEAYEKFGYVCEWKINRLQKFFSSTSEKEMNGRREGCS